MAFCETKKAVLLFFVTITRLEDYKWEQQKSLSYRPST